MFLGKRHENIRLTGKFQDANISALLDKLFLAELMFSLVLNKESEQFIDPFGKHFLNKISQSQLVSHF